MARPVRLSLPTPHTQLGAALSLHMPRAIKTRSSGRASELVCVWCCRVGPWYGTHSCPALTGRDGPWTPVRRHWLTTPPAHACASTPPQSQRRRPRWRRGADRRAGWWEEAARSSPRRVHTHTYGSRPLSKCHDLAVLVYATVSTRGHLKLDGSCVLCVQSITDTHHLRAHQPEAVSVVLGLDHLHATSLSVIRMGHMPQVVKVTRFRERSSGVEREGDAEPYLEHERLPLPLAQPADGQAHFRLIHQKAVGQL